MKKAVVLLTSLVLFAGMLFGCTNPAMPSAVAERLEYSLNTLQYTVKNLDTIDNAYLANPDIAPVINTNKTLSLTATPRKQAGGTIAKAMTVLAQPVEINENFISQNNAVVKNENDETIVNSEITETNFVENSFENQSVNYDKEKIITENSYTTTNYETNQINQTNENLVNDNNQMQNNFATDNKLNNNNHINNQTNINNNYDVNRPTYRSYRKNYTYNPRYVNNNVINNNNNEYFENYLTKVENLYSMTNDAIEANNMLTSCKENLLSCISELRTLAIEMKNGSYTPSVQQIDAINNYINDIKTTISRIRSTNGQLNNEVNKINNYDKEGMTISIDVLNSNYIRILNHIDVRITYLKNALATLEQVKALLIEAQMLDQQEFETTTQFNQNLTQENLTDDVEKENVNNLNEHLVKEEDTNINNEVNETLPQNDINQTTNYDLNNQINQNTQEETINPVLPLETQTETVKKEIAPKVDEEIEETNKNEMIDKNNTEKETNDEDEKEKPLTNIDTYKKAHKEQSSEIINRIYERKNIDTYAPQNDTINNGNNVVNNNETLNDDVNINNVPPMVNNNIPNNAGVGVNNGINNMVYETGNNEINTPNGTFQNGIITQNNLNQGVNNGVNGVRTGYSGSTNSPYTVDNKGRVRNINTYGHNTLIDIINRGTVNNGINTLSLNPIEDVNTKPNMVNNNQAEVIHPNAYMAIEPYENQFEFVEKIIA